MSNRKAPIPYDIFTTGDGSPTMSLGGGEKMHSLAGALSESLYVYAGCLQSLQGLRNPKVLSMGLGLAYNELIALAQFHTEAVDDFQILSFEKVIFLQRALEDWLLDKDSELSGLYEKILQSVARHYSITNGALKEIAITAFREQKWKMAGELSLVNPENLKYHAILYDAFSGESDPALWQQDFLENVIKIYADATYCCFTTYAATGNLTRALKAQGFQVDKKKGFANKRESTFATRFF